MPIAQTAIIKSATIIKKNFGRKRKFTNFFGDYADTKREGNSKSYFTIKIFSTARRIQRYLSAMYNLTVHLVENCINEKFFDIG